MDKTLYEEFFPPLRRARGCFLYGSDGRRFLDLYRDGGRAVLGHRPGGLQRVIKSTVSKGLLAGYPSVYERRVKKALQLLFPEAVSFYLYRDRYDLYRALAGSLGMKIGDVVPADPLKGEPGDISLWRPFDGGIKTSSPVLVPIIPLPGGIAPEIAVVFDKSIRMEDGPSPSPFVLNSTVKLLYELADKDSAPGEELLGLFDSPFWERKGVYLLFNTDDKGYRDLFIKSLDAGVILPPGRDIPGIVPLTFEYGNVKKFLKVVKER